MTHARHRSGILVAVTLALLAALLPRGAGAAPTLPVTTQVTCDPIDPAACLLPFPNDLFTTSDPTTATRLRVNLSIDAMPRTGAEITEGGEGKPADPTEWNRNDGFSPGSPILTYIPGIDLHRTWFTWTRPHSTVGPNEPGYFDHRDHIADIGLYKKPGAPIVILNARTREPHPFWSELDTHPGAVAADEQVLILRPAVNFEEGERYIVAMRNLRREDGTILPPGAAFKAYRNNAGASAARQLHYNGRVFPILADAGIPRENLYIAWDFTVASERNLAERVLHMRDDAFGRLLGDHDLANGLVEGAPPSFTVDGTETRTHTWTDSSGVPRSIELRRVRGRVTVPNYLDRIQQTEAHFKSNGKQVFYYDSPAPGSRLLDIDGDGLPDQNPVESTVNASFVCDIPLNETANYPVLYGHGLLGDRDQINDVVKSPGRHGPFMGCAADWWGMSTPDIATVATILTDLSNFPSLADRAQQGFLNFMFLGRALAHPQGLASHIAFQQDGAPLIKTSTPTDTWLFYDGNSQGGIMGGSLVAVSPDISRAVLGVPAMNYSTLLNRSVDWEGSLEDYNPPDDELPAYSVPFYESYRDPLERQIVFALMQMVWDRGEANGYAAHMTSDPLPNTPPHEIMLQVAFSDHQVSNHAAEVEALTIGAPTLDGLAPGRHWAMIPFNPSASYPHQGSGLVYWDSGNATPPNGNIPPSHAGDPHGHPRDEPAAGWQEAQFLLTGWLVDVCQGGAYLTRRHPANGGSSSCLEPTWVPGSRNF